MNTFANVATLRKLGRQLTTQNMPRFTRQLLWVSGGLALSAVPHVSGMNLGLLLFAIGCTGWRLAIELKSWPTPHKLLRTLVALIAMGTVLATYRTLNGLEAGTAFLVLMGSIKLLETRNARDLTIVVFVAYFLLFAGFLYNQQLLWLPYMLACAWLLTATLMRIHQGASMTAREALGTTGKMLLQAVPLAALMFVFFPRLPGQFWALPARSATTGLDDEMSPGDVSDLTVSGAIAFRVRFDNDVLPPARERYWRGPVLHDFDGRTWRRPQYPYIDRPPLVPGGDGYRYRVVLEPHNRHWIFGLDAVTRWPERTRRTFDQQLVSLRPISTLTSFDLQSHTRFSTAGELPRSLRNADLRLPSNRNPRALALARELRQRSASDAAFIQAVLRKFNAEEYFYTLEPPRLEADSVDDFLFNTRRGFCEHFASAFTVMARAAGIPARVVTGYQGGEFNPLNGYLIVRQSDAHAWSEVWLDDQGWVRVDPTAAIAPQRIERGLDAAMNDDEAVPGRIFVRSEFLTQLRNAWDAANTFWNDRVVGFDIEQQRSLMAYLGIENADWEELGLGLAAALALFFVVLSAYLAMRFKPRTRDPVAQVYEQLCKRLARQSMPRAAHEGPDDYLTRVAQRRPELSTALNEFRSIYISLRYGPTPLLSQLSRLKYLVNQLKL